jgi:DNA-binding protein H-NS
MEGQMDRPERTDKDDNQKLKLIFLTLAALVTILLIWSLVTANRARTERDVARQEAETLKQDNAKLEQFLKDQNLKIDELNKKVLQCEAAAKAKPKPAAKKKPTPAKSTKKSSKRK